MVIDGLHSVADGVAALAPQHAQAANDAASVAEASLEGVLQVLKDTGHPLFGGNPNQFSGTTTGLGSAGLAATSSK